MRHIYLIILLTFWAIPSLGQTSSGTWDDKTATYTNKAHKLSWKLIDELKWDGRPILTSSTLLKVRNDDTYILVKLGATHYVGPEQDAWEVMAFYESPDYKKMIDATAKSEGMKVVDSKAIKSQLCGIHANKLITHYSKFLSEYQETIHRVDHTYQVAVNNYTYTLSVTALMLTGDELKDFEKVATKIFNGFQINR